MQPSTLYLPDFQHFNGLNDRFMMATPDVAEHVGDRMFFAWGTCGTRPIHAERLMQVRVPCPYLRLACRLAVPVSAWLLWAVPQLVLEARVLRVRIAAHAGSRDGGPQGHLHSMRRSGWGSVAALSQLGMQQSHVECACRRLRTRTTTAS